MKNFTQLFSLVFLASFLLASCAQSKDLAQNDTKEHTRRYYKEYIGNKIIYHDKATDESVDEDFDGDEVASLDQVGELESQKTIIAPPKTEKAETVDEEALPAESVKKESKSKPFLKNFYTKIKKNHHDVVTGRVFTKKYYKEKKANSSGSRAVGAAEIFGLLALIFGASSFAFGVPGLIFGILGIVFGIIGLDADSFWGVFALVGLILGAVGAALSFIFLLV